MSFLRRCATDSPDIVRRLHRRGAPLVVALLAACDAASAPPDRSPVTLSFASRSTSTVVTDVTWLGAGAAFDLRGSDGDNTLVVTSVELVFDEIELELAGLAGGCADDSSGDGSSGPGSGSGSDDCAEIESGPQLVNLPLGGEGTPTLATIPVPIPTGTYSELELKLRPLNPRSGEDRAFIAAHPDLAGVSARVRGTWDGTPFEYATSLDEEIELDFSPPLEVAESGVNITVNLDVLSWFRNADGTLIDPRTAVSGQPNASVVSANIGTSLAVFQDDDHDGQDDHGGHGGHGSDD